jgi:peptide/nickel transport system substrate-binding protein/oligopeptide transport system substrate-binding protein
VDPDTVEGDLTLLGGPSFLGDIVGFDAVIANETDELSGVEVIDDSSLAISIKAPRATFLMKLASVPASIVDRQQVESDSSWWASPNGSGPYRVDRWEPGDSLELERYDEFVLGEPFIEFIHYRLGANSLQSFNLYQQDEIDIDSINLNDIDRVADPNGPFADQLQDTVNFAFGYIMLNSGVAPLDDPEIRNALQLAFPRTDIANVTFNGWVSPATGVVPDGMLGQGWPNVLPDQDFDAAREAISRSSYGSPESVPPIRIFGSGSLAGEALRSIAEEELGLTIEVFDLEWYDFLERLTAGTLPAYELYWAADYPDPEAILLALFGTGQPDNYVGYSNPALDDLLDEAAAEPDASTRAEIYEEADAVLAEDNIVLPTYTDVQYTVVKPWVFNVVVTPIGILRLETVQIDS